MMDIGDIAALANDHGLILRGGIRVEGDEGVPDCPSGEAAAMLLLFGQAGSAIWPHFSGSPEYRDGQADPLDRWSTRVGNALAQQLGGMALFPFEGPPWYPFGQWAQRAESLRPSPLGILMHPAYGLWHAYRFAVALPSTSIPDDGLPITPSAPRPGPHACDSCVGAPCLRACPVDAIQAGGYDVAACAAYLRAHDDAPCHQLGCLARAACPESRETRYEPVHCQFHIRQFLASLP